MDPDGKCESAARRERVVVVGQQQLQRAASPLAHADANRGRGRQQRIGSLAPSGAVGQRGARPVTQSVRHHNQKYKNASTACCTCLLCVHPIHFFGLVNAGPEQDNIGM